MVVPLIGNEPLHPPDASQVLALVALHTSVTDAPMATVASLAFKVTNGGAAVVGAVALLVVVLPVAVSLAAVLSTVSPFELAPHAASEPSAAITNIDFNANAIPMRRLRRIEPIHVSQDSLRQIFSRSFDSIHPQSLRSHIHSIFSNRQPVAICKLHMSSGAIEFICVLKIEKSHCEISRRALATSMWIRARDALPSSGNIFQTERKSL